MDNVHKPVILDIQKFPVFSATRKSRPLTRQQAFMYFTYETDFKYFGYNRPILKP
jgi:hypothetical protein